MKKYAQTVLAGVLGLALLTVAAAGPPPKNLRPQVLDVVCDVRTDPEKVRASGTLIYVRDELMVLTAAHCVGKDKDPLRVILRDGRSFDAAVLYCLDHRAGEIDMALLVPIDPPAGLRAAKILPKDFDVQEGEDAWYCGSGGGRPFSLERTIINQVLPKVGDIVVNGHVWYGHSGSGLFVERDGEFFLAGVVTRMSNPDEQPKSVGFVDGKVNTFLQTYLKRRK